MKTHPFESITEEQWKSGVSRHQCAECFCDYADPIHGESNWPLVIALEDCFNPILAPIVTQAAAAIDDEHHALVIKFKAEAAREGICVN